MPVLGGGAGNPPTSGTKSGTTTVFATTSGTLTTGDCVSISSGNLIDAGGACTTGGGGGTVNSGTANQLAYYATSTNAVSGLAPVVNNAVLVTSGAGVPSESTTLPTGLTIPGYNASITWPTANSAMISAGPGNNSPTGVAPGTATVLYSASNTWQPTSLPTVAVTNLSGTAGAITASGSVGSVTLNLPATITPNLTFSGTHTISGGTTLSNTVTDTYANIAPTASASATLDALGFPAGPISIGGASTTISTAKGFNFASFYQPTYNAINAQTINNAATVYIDGPPIAGTNVTITNAYALKINAGNVSFGGGANVLGTISSGTWNGTAVGVQYGGTGANLSATGGANQVLQQTSSGGAVTVGQLAAANLSNGTTGSGGAIVLATSPTISAPTLTGSSNLGTPGSIALNNATSASLPLAAIGGAAVSNCLLGVTGPIWAASAQCDLLNVAQTFAAVKTFPAGDLVLSNTSGGTTTLNGAASASNVTITVPAATDTVDLIGTAQTFSATKTFSTAPAFTAAGAPFSVTSSTNVANLNASSLNGATFAAPGAIGGTTPAAGTFTSVTSNGLTSGLCVQTGAGGLLTTATSACATGTPAFSALSGGTNTTAAMVVGAGSSLNYTSTGTINASSLNGVTLSAPGTLNGVVSFSTTTNMTSSTTLPSGLTIPAPTLTGASALGTPGSITLTNATAASLPIAAIGGAVNGSCMLGNATPAWSASSTCLLTGGGQTITGSDTFTAAQTFKSNVAFQASDASVSFTVAPVTGAVSSITASGSSSVLPGFTSVGTNAGMGFTVPSGTGLFTWVNGTITMGTWGTTGIVLNDATGVAAGTAQGAGTINAKGLYVNGQVVGTGGGNVSASGTITNGAIPLWASSTTLSGSLLIPANGSCVLGSAGAWAVSATCLLTNAAQTISATKTFSTAPIVSATALPAQAAGNLGLAGTAALPTLGATAEGDIFLTAAGGLNLVGDGSTSDFTLLNKSNQSVCSVATGTTALTCANLIDSGIAANAIVKGGGSAAMSASSMTDAGAGVVVGSPTGGAQGAGSINAATLYDNGVAVATPITASWAPGQNLQISGTNVGISLYTTLVARTVGSITCRMDKAVGASGDTIQVWMAPSGTALSSGTQLTGASTPCNADTGTLYTNQTGLLGATTAIPANSSIGIIAVGSNWGSSGGAGAVTIILN